MATATTTPAPSPPSRPTWTRAASAEFNALCVGTADFNGFYGDGIVNALAAVQ